MGYSTEENMVRVDFFKKSGKWYVTEAVKFLYYFTPGSPHSRAGGSEMDIVHAFEESLRAHLKDKEGGDGLRLAGMTAVCLEPYHEHAHPLMLTVPET